MTDRPLVSIITPTWNRHDSLLNVCIPSVKKQTYPNIEHIIVSDGPDPVLYEKLFDVFKTPPYLRSYDLGRNWGGFTNRQSIGAVPRNVGLAMAKGQYIAYLDDDDEFLSDHIETLVNEIEQKGVDFAFSQMQRDLDGNKDLLIGDGNIFYGHIGTPMVVHKAECLKHGMWSMDGYAEDFQFVKRLVDAGCSYSFVPKVTILYHKKA